MQFRRLLAIFSGCLLVLVGLALTTATLPTAAQEEPGPIPSYENPPEIAATQEAYDRAFDEELANRSIFDFRIAYLVSDEVAGESTVAPENLKAATGALEVNTWDEFLRLNDLQPFQIILIHVSMQHQVDTDWLASAYRNNIIVVGINIRSTDLANLVQDNCLSHSKEDLLDYADNVWRYFTYHIQLANESEREYVNKVELTDCTRNETGIYEGRGQIIVRHGVIQSTVYRQVQLEELADSLKVETIQSQLSPSGVIPLPTDTLSK